MASTPAASRFGFKSKLASPTPATPSTSTPATTATPAPKSKLAGAAPTPATPATPDVKRAIPTTASRTAAVTPAATTTPASKPPIVKRVSSHSPTPSTASTEIDDTESTVTDDSDATSTTSSIPAAGRRENVRVCVRVRPMNQMEIQSRQVEAWSFRDDSIIFQTYMPEHISQAPASQHAKPIAHVFDHVFTEERTNSDIFECIGRETVSNTMTGYHSCVFAYGQTSSGKTYTIHGTHDDPGLISLCVENIFTFIEESPDREFVLRVSYLEIYNEIVNDLLNPLNTNLLIREDKKRGVFVEGLKEDIVVSPEQVFSLLSAGEAQRHVGKTNYNEMSSRSHTVFRLVVESTVRNSQKGSSVRLSTLNLVDLAGSENAVKAGSASRVKETGYINRSLLTLGHVIYKLSEKNVGHLPYRDSKLTRILQSALSGKACVAVVCTISPSALNLDETISTLKFANRAKKVKNSAVVNEVFDESTLLRQYRDEIDRLKRELANARAQHAAVLQTLPTSPATNEGDDSDSEYKRDPNEDIDAETNALTNQIDQLTRLILHSTSVSEPLQIDVTPHADAQPGPPSPTRAAANAAISTTAEAQAVGQIARRPSKGPAALAKGFFNAYSPRVDLPSIASHPSSAHTSHPSSTTHSTTSSTRASPSSLKRHLHPSSSTSDETMELRARIVTMEEKMNELLLENQTLKKQLAVQEQALNEWERYYITVQNKNAAIESAKQAQQPSHMNGDEPSEDRDDEAERREIEEILAREQLQVPPDGGSRPMSRASQSGKRLSINDPKYASLTAQELNALEHLLDNERFETPLVQ